MQVGFEEVPILPLLHPIVEAMFLWLFLFPNSSLSRKIFGTTGLSTLRVL